jgi:Uma2 family endonuclease
MATISVELGPLDHGRPLTLEEFLSSRSKKGYHYELIDGRLYVAPLPNLPEDYNEKWLFGKVQQYSRIHPEIINHVTDKARVFVPGRPRITAPEPDLAAYHAFPHEISLRKLRWQDVSPILVGEVISADDPDKDFVRNVRLYLQVPSIKEYWILDTREDPDRPMMLVYRRSGRNWRQITVAPVGRYTTKLLPDFELILDPRR